MADNYGLNDKDGTYGAENTPKEQQTLSYVNQKVESAQKENATSFANLQNQIGVLTTLKTVVKTSLVAALNELSNSIGVLGVLSTTAKNSLVAAINELFTDKADLSWVKQYGLGTTPVIITDCNALSGTGDTGFYNCTATTLNIPPDVTSGGALIHNAKSTRPCQIFQSYTNNRFYTRTYMPSGWTNWDRLTSLTDLNNIGILADSPTVTDANNVTSSGVYTITAGCLNVPTTSGSLIHVRRDGSRPTQMYHDYTTNVMYTRSYTAAGWTGWVSLVKLTVDGILNVPTQSYFTVSTGTDLAIASNVDTLITMTSEGSDTYNEFTNNIWTPKETGVYMISIAVAWLAVNPGITTFKMYNQSTGTVSLSQFMGDNAKTNLFSRPVKLTGGIPFQFYLNQNSGASQTMDSMYVYITKIS